MCATWDKETRSEDDSDSEEACFMVMKEHNDDVEDNAPIYDDFLIAFEELDEEWRGH